MRVSNHLPVHLLGIAIVAAGGIASCGSSGSPTAAAATTSVAATATTTEAAGVDFTDRLRAAWSGLVADGASREAMSRLNFAACDGQGAARTADAITALAAG